MVSSRNVRPYESQSIEHAEGTWYMLAGHSSCQMDDAEQASWREYQSQTRVAASINLSGINQHAIEIAIKPFITKVPAHITFVHTFVMLTA